MTGRFEQMTMSDGAEVELYRATPDGARKGGIVLVQEIFGLTEHITDLCDGFAADGYELLAPALYDREHPGFRADYSGEGFARAVELARKIHPFELSMKDVQSCIDALKAAGPVFIVGYCYGGSVAWEAAATLDGLAAASAYYGSMAPTAFIDHAPKVPTIAHFGRFDQGIPMEGVESLIAKQHPNATVYIYEAGHGFNSDRRKDYHEPSAHLARERTLALFEANGG
jgi:carboxymethylenebutenolidase